MAGVWEAFDELLGRPVAIKVLASHLSEDERARRRFEREGRAAAGLSSHPHVVTIYDVGERDGRAFIVMELMRGGSIAQRLKEGRAIADETALRWLREAAGALDAAHDAGVVHRDIKPGNLLLDDRDRLAIADFGIARLAMEDQLTATGQVLGTASYISPEQAVGEPATTASDRYALAVVAFELLTGQKPFHAEHFAAQARAHVEDRPPLATERDPSLPQGVDAVLDRGLAKAPGDRWATATAMIGALDRAMSSSRAATEPTRPLAAVAPPRPAEDGDRGGTSAAAPPPVERGRRGAAWMLAGLAGVILVAVLAFLLLSGGDGDNPPSTDREPTATATAEATREATPEATREATPEATPEATAEATPEATSEPEPEPTAEATPEASGQTDLDRAAGLQVQGFNARQAGDNERALTLSQQALEACGDAQQLSPCGYALFEVGAALNGLGRYEEAIPFLEQRLEQYGDNSSGEVKRELKAAQKGARD